MESNAKNTATAKTTKSSKTSNKENRRARVISILNQARGMELHAISQYMSQHYSLDDMDYGTLAGNMKLIAIDEMRHAEMFAERIKVLDGEPVTDYTGVIVKKQAILNVYTHNTDLEDDTIEVYNQFLKECRENNDIISAQLFETIIGEEQTHLDYFENISGHVKSLGTSYLSKIAGTSSSTGGTTKGFVIAPLGGDTSPA